VAYKSPLEVLYDDTTARLTTLGSDLGHSLGEREVAAHTNINRYVWVPTRIRVDQSGNYTAAVDQRRMLFPVVHVCEVRCWGQSREVAWLMASNLIKALHDAAAADIDLDSLTWTDGDEGHTDFGHLLVVEFGLRGAIADEYVDVAAYTGAAQTATAPDAPAVETESVSFTAYAGEDTDEDHEEMGSGTVNDE
jgi:hypothetical protein